MDGQVIMMAEYIDNYHGWMDRWMERQWWMMNDE